MKNEMSESLHEPVMAGYTDVNALKVQLINRIMRINKPDSLHRIIELTKQERMADDEDAPLMFTEEQQKRELQISMNQIKEGQTISDADIRQLLKSYQQ